VAPQKVIFWAWLSHEAVDCFAHSLLFLAEVMNICWLIPSYPSLSQIPVFCVLNSINLITFGLVLKKSRFTKRQAVGQLQCGNLT